MHSEGCIAALERFLIRAARHSASASQYRRVVESRAVAIRWLCRRGAGLVGPQKSTALSRTDALAIRSFRTQSDVSSGTSFVRPLQTPLASC